MEAAFFDGISSRRQLVNLDPAPTGLNLVGEGIARHFAAAEISVSEPAGKAPRTLRFADGTYCEVIQGPELTGLLDALGYHDGAVVRLQKRWSIALAALFFTLIIAAAAYRWALPWAAAVVAPRLPAAFSVMLSDQVMAWVDSKWLRPSQLSQQRRDQLKLGFESLTANDPALPGAVLLFRHAGKGFANAFALPDGRIVVFDEMVELADDDAEVMAVLGHEAGHLKFHHGLRQLIQSSVVGVCVASYLGDFSLLLTGLTTLLIESSYSREFELEADDYGAALLQRSGGSAHTMALMLEKLDRESRKRDESETRLFSSVSSHPEIAERTRRLRSLP
jgi:Zn-dependent protease with chaperone function